MKYLPKIGDLILLVHSNKYFLCISNVRKGVLDINFIDVFNFESFKKEIIPIDITYNIIS